MKKFKYKAKKGPKEVVEGILAAENQDRALDKIHEMGLIPVDLQEDRSLQTVSSPWGEIRRKVGSRDLAQFYRQLAALVKAGIPLVKAFSFLGRENSNPLMKEVITSLETNVREGHGLQAALSRYPRIFSPLDRGIIQAGESGGKIEEALLRVAQYRSNQESLRSKVRAALAYPALITAVGIASMIFMLTSIIPKFATFFSGLGQSLPLPTRILIAVSGWMKWGWLVILLGGGALFFFFKWVQGSPERKMEWDSWLLKLPKAGPLMLKFEITNLARSLSLLLRSGIPVLSAIRTSIPVLSNEALKNELEKVYRGLEQGGYLSQGFDGARFFPSFFVHIVSVGEEAGRLEEALLEVADWYEMETSEAVQTMTTLLEPMMILIVGVILGVMIISILLPIFNMSTIVS